MLRTSRLAAALLFATLLALHVAAQQSQPQAPAGDSPSSSDAQTSKSKSLVWDPPKIDAKLRSSSDASPCDLDKVLAQAGARATELVENLQNFTAREQIDYRTFGAGGFGDNRGGGSASFDYTATLARRGSSFVVKESRRVTQAAMEFPLENQDIGMPEMALIFHPDLRPDYDMKCEAATNWKDRAAWIISFRQRKDRPNHTAAFHTNQRSYPVPLRGRAWIAQHSGVVIHMEIAMMHEIPAVAVREWYLSIDYASVRFRSKDIVVWLPQSADTYATFDIDRVVVSHTFSDFLLFSVQTSEQISQPH